MNRKSIVRFVLCSIFLALSQNNTAMHLDRDASCSTVHIFAAAGKLVDGIYSALALLTAGFCNEKCGIEKIDPPYIEWLAKKTIVHERLTYTASIKPQCKRMIK